jgi:hypothetical protein
VLGAYYAIARSLPNFSLWTEVGFLGLLIIPAVLGLVYLALPLWRAQRLLVAGLGFAALAVALELVDASSIANFAKLAALTALAFWFLSYFETEAWVTLVALIIPIVDAFSVFRGPTGHVVKHQPGLFDRIAVGFPVPGETNFARLGPPDLLFFALFLAAADRFKLRVGWTWIAMTLSFGGTLALAVATKSHGLPALPLLSLGFLLPNADILWKRLRRQDAWGRLETKRKAAD